MVFWRPRNSRFPGLCYFKFHCIVLFCTGSDWGQVEVSSCYLTYTCVAVKEKKKKRRLQHKASVRPGRKGENSTRVPPFCCCCSYCTRSSTVGSCIFYLFIYFARLLRGRWQMPQTGTLFTSETYRTAVGIVHIVVMFRKNRLPSSIVFCMFHRHHTFIGKTCMGYRRNVCNK